MKTLHSHLLYLSGVGLCGLWGLGFLNGLFLGLDAAAKSRLLPDGRPVRDAYTGIYWLDQELALLAVFYVMLTDGLFTGGPRMLFLDINVVVACTNLWVLLESRRVGQRSLLLRYPAWIMMLSNAGGAAIFQPPFLYALARSRARLRDPIVDVADAVALFATAPLIMLSPFLLSVPAWLGMSNWQHQGYIALFHASPLLLNVTLVALAAFFRFTELSRHLLTARGFIVASLVFAGIVSAAVHVHTVLGALAATDPDATLSRVFVPSHGRANPFPSWIKTLPSAVSGVPEKHAALIERFHLFSQYDWLLILSSCCVYCHILLSGHDGLIEEETEQAENKYDWRELVYLLLGSIVVGPGAAGSFAMVIRESRIQGQFRSPEMKNRRGQEKSARKT